MWFSQCKHVKSWVLLIGSTEIRYKKTPDGLWRPGRGDEDFLQVSSSVDNERGDLPRQSVEDEEEEDREDGEDERSDDELLELLPDEEDEGLHWVDEPGEAGGGTTRGTTGDRLHLLTPGLSLQQINVCVCVCVCVCVVLWFVQRLRLFAGFSHRIGLCLF